MAAELCTQALGDTYPSGQTPRPGLGCLLGDSGVGAKVPVWDPEGMQGREAERGPGRRLDPCGSWEWGGVSWPGWTELS